MPIALGEPGSPPPAPRIAGPTQSPGSQISETGWLRHQLRGYGNITVLSLLSCRALLGAFQDLPPSSDPEREDREAADHLNLRSPRRLEDDSPRAEDRERRAIRRARNRQPRPASCPDQRVLLGFTKKRARRFRAQHASFLSWHIGHSSP